MKTRIIYSPVTGKKMAEFRDGDLVWFTDEYANPVQSVEIMPDIQPYKSMIDGSLITSRSKHREHLKAHNCFEVGNDSSLRSIPKPLQSPPGLKEDILRAFERRR